MNNSKKTEPARLLNETEAAGYCGMSVSFLQKARANGTLANRTPGPKFKKIGRKVVYDRNDLDIWIDSFKSLNHLAEAAAND